MSKDKPAEKSNQLDEKPVSKRELARQGVLAVINKKFNLRVTNHNSEYVPMYRLSTGVFSLDVATHGGIPMGRVTKIHGSSSSGKTTIAYRLIADAQRRSQETGKYLFEEKDPKNKVPMKAIFFDLEGTFDKEWAAYHGVNLAELDYIKPSTAEETGTSIAALIRAGAYDLIVLDSLAQMISAQEFDSALEEHNVGISAKQNNKMFRQVQAALNELAKDPDRKILPALIVLNQQRAGMSMYGPKLIEPGGEGQKFAVSVNIKLSGNKIDYFDKDKKYPRATTITFLIEKNKTGAPKVEGDFEMAVANDPDGEFKKGQIFEEKNVVDFAEKCGFLSKDGAKWKMFDEVHPRKEDVLEKWFRNADRYAFVKANILKALFQKS